VRPGGKSGARIGPSSSSHRRMFIPRSSVVLSLDHNKFPPSPDAASGQPSRRVCSSATARRERAACVAQRSEGCIPQNPVDRALSCSLIGRRCDKRDRAITMRRKSGFLRPLSSLGVMSII
jgi:hypothetical protein